MGRNNIELPSTCDGVSLLNPITIKEECIDEQPSTFGNVWKNKNGKEGRIQMCSLSKKFGGSICSNTEIV